MKAFIYEGQLYLRTIPGKRLFNSTMVHEVVNRGDIFAVRLVDQLLTIVPGTSKVEHIEIDIPAMHATPAPDSFKELRAELKAKIAAASGVR